MSKKNKITYDHWLVLLIVSISGWVTSYDTFFYKKFYWDSPKFFSIFRDNLQSLNFFHEIAYWFPHVSTGWPAYYYSSLGDLNCTGPIFVILGFGCWLAGIVGITIQDYFNLYAIYISFLVPMALTFGAYALARQLFTSKYILYFIVILTAFSPGVILNLSDVGLSEVAAYALFFFAAYIKFLKKPDVRNFYLLVITIMLIGLTLNFPFVFWNAFAIPVFIFFVSLWPMKRFQHSLAAFKSISLKHYLLAICLILISLIPNVSTYLQSDMIRTTIGEAVYTLEKLLPGNPLELLSISLPGFGFEWRSHALSDSTSGLFWTLLPVGDYNLAICYLGLLSLPLTVLGLIYGAKSFRTPILWMLVIMFTIIVLAATSPIFALLLSVKSPLQANKHFSDACFRSGGYLFLIFSSALGLRTLLKGNDKIRTIFLYLLGIELVINTTVHIFYYEKLRWMSNPFFGLHITFSILFIIVAYSMKTQPKNKALIPILLFITFVDISTCSNLIVKNFKYVNNGVNFNSLDEAWNTNNIGLDNSVPGSYSGTILIQRSLYNIHELSIYPQKDFKKFIFFSAVHPSDDIYKDIERLPNALKNIKASFKDYDSLPISPKDAQRTSVKRFIVLAQTLTEPATGTVDIISQTYNKLELHINSSRVAALFILDSYSPYWKAWLNGQRTDISCGFYNFKTVIVPKGESKLLLKFKPPLIGPALLISYFSIFVILIFFICSRSNNKG